MTGKVRSLEWCVELPTSDLSSDYKTQRNLKLRSCCY